MAARWLSTVALISICAASASAAFMIFDILLGHRQKMAIMNLVWPITAFYFGPFALWPYWRLGRQSVSQKPFWQSTFVSSTHCGAGCVLGDVIGEWTVFLFGITIAGSKLLADYVLDFALAYSFRIAFQYFAIVPMRHLRPAEGIKEAIKADTIALVAFEVGMFAWMAFAAKAFFGVPPHPDSAVYWFMMQIGTIVGFATTYLANWLLMKRGVKGGM